ncbi:MAG TPA: VWA domain-containing protein [Clostridiales bacterium]|nr:VWA domain-containing protein [Clostridiales bacterium]
MNFLNPWGILYGVFIGAIILFYMLKPRHTELVISSTYLWDKTIKDMEASRPWQRLKNNLLMLLQIVTAILFVLAIMRPYVAKSSFSGDMVVILDSSGSMQARDVSPTRFERAQEDILKIIDGMLPSQKMGIVSMGSNGQIITEPTGDKGELRRLIKEMEPENGGGGQEEALSIAGAMSSNLEEPQVIIYSDTQFEIDRSNYHSIVINESGENVAVQGVTYTVQGEEIVVLSKIKSYGYDGNIRAECIQNGKLVDVREVHIEDGELLDIYWHDIEDTAKTIQVSLDVDDDLSADNSAYAVVEGGREHRILFVSEGNIFLEKAIGQYPKLEIVKTVDTSGNLEGYDMYIFDGVEIESLPKDGHIMILNPKGDMSLFNIDKNGEFKPSGLTTTRSILSDKLLAFTDLDDIYIGSGIAISPPSWAESIIESGDGNPLLIAGENGNRKAILFSFDIHKSDLPLKADFPILIQNILDWIFSGSGVEQGSFYSGEELLLNVIPTADKIEVIDPMENNFTGDILQDIGIYEVIQYIDGEEQVDYFAVNFPVNTESDLSSRLVGHEVDIKTSADSVAPQELWKYVLWIVLALLMIEWWLYAYGY